jgi:hypothetical protein
VQVNLEPVVLFIQAREVTVKSGHLRAEASGALCRSRAHDIRDQERAHLTSNLTCTNLTLLAKTHKSPLMNKVCVNV